LSLIKYTPFADKTLPPEDDLVVGRNILRSVMKPSTYMRLCYEGSLILFNKHKH